MSSAPRTLSQSTILRYERLEGIAERGLSDLVKLAAQVLHVERCFVGLSQPEDGWLRSVVGVSPSEVREFALLCTYGMMENGPTFIDDARKIEIFAHIPAVTKPTGIRFLASVPIATADGVVRGALMLADSKVRTLTEGELRIFLGFAEQVKNHVELHTRIDDIRNNHAAQVGALSMLKGLLRAATTFAIIGTDTIGRITLFSEGAERMLGMKAEKAIGITPLAFLDPREVKLRGAALSEKLGHPVQGFPVLVAECDGDAPVENTWTMHKQSGATFQGLLVAVRVVEETGQLKGYALIGRDITEQRAVDRMKDEFVSMVSHELRTPLTAIFGALGLAKEGVVGAVPDEFREVINIAHSNTSRLLRIVNDILDVHSLESGALSLQFATIDVLTVVERAVELTRPFAASFGTRLAIVEGAHRALIRADFERWVQVMMNLLSNAVKYSPKGGRVDISVHADKAKARVTIRDYGAGIPAELRSRVFEKFAQAKTGDARVGGTGLGLAIVKSIIELHGGRVGFDSSPTQGTAFFVEQPLELEPRPGT